MKYTLTVKLKLQTTSDQFSALRRTQLAYRDALNYVSQYAYAHGKMSNKARLQAGTYPENHTGIAGVDVGVRYLAVATTTTGQQSFYSGKQVVAKANHYARLRKRLQQKGTRSATRRLIQISGREGRLKADANHVVSKLIVKKHPQSLIGLEHLTGIRERTKRKKGKRATKKQRKTNATHSKWSFAELHSMIAYKALLHGSMVIKVDAHYTSKACPVCGHTADANRPHKGLLFICQNCQYTLHADLVGARNITMRTLCVRQDWIRTGRLSVVPDTSDHEAKAERLRRYSELRWSPDASPLHSCEGI